MFKGKNLGEMKTTITGVLVALLSILVAFGVIDPAKQPELTTGITTAVGGIIAIVLTFGAKDGNKK